MLERDVVREIMLKTCDQIDWMKNPRGYDEAHRVAYGCGGTGAADFLGIRRRDGRFVACEVKRPVSGVVSPAQELFLTRVRRSGGIGFIARSVEDVLDAIG